MTAPPGARRGEILPGFTLPDVDGTSLSLESSRGRANLVVVFAGGELVRSPVTALLDELLSCSEELAFEAAQVLVVVSSRSDTVAQRVGWRFPTLVDEGALIHGMVGGGDAEAKPAPAVFVTDRFREIYAAWHGSELPRAQEVLDWLIFINIQCPECGWPEWPA